MVKIIQLEPDIAVAPQLVEADFADIAARSFRTVVNNRPDGEAPDQLPNTQAAAAAHRHGLEFRYHPVRYLNVIDDEVVDTFARLMEDLPEPIVFYCGTRARCTILWTLAAAGRLGVDEALAVANKAGYDLDFLRDTLAGRYDLPVVTAAQSSASGDSWLAGLPAVTCTRVQSALLVLGS